MPDKNTLYYGDNLNVLRRYIPDNSVDLIYLDPPFNSRQDYSVLFAEKDGSSSASQITAFKDTWEWNEEAARAYEEVVEQGGRVAEAMRAFRTLLGGTDMLAYLAMMAPRLVELRRVLTDTGSIYLHCDPTASHYLKLIMDSVFGPQMFRSEVIWKRTNTHSDAKRWSPVTDSIFYYGKTSLVTWHPHHTAHSDEYISSKYRSKGADGRAYTLDNMTSPSARPNMMYEWKGHLSPPLGWRYSVETMKELDEQGRIWYPKDKTRRPRLKRYLDEMSGVLTGNVWTDISPINSQAQERLGYPTQKPEALLERILRASSNEGDVVLDPFCGCGTTVQVAQKLNRRWIGIDITHLAIGLIKTRLDNTFGGEVRSSYQVHGEPKDISGARQLAEENKYQFQHWALGLCGGQSLGGVKKGADRGIDGRINFHEKRGGETKQIIFSVKGGRNIGVAEVRDLIGVLQREKADIGAYISFEEPTKAMLREAAEAGFYKSIDGSLYPRVQLLTIKALMEGTQRLERPWHVEDVTFKKAPQHRSTPAKNLRLDLISNQEPD